MSDNIIEIINNDYIVEIEEASYTIETGNISVCNYEHMPNKPKINSVELVGNKTSSDLNLVSTTDIALKEDISNKVITINASSSDEQYPSAKCLYNGLLSKSNIDLSNLSEIGQAVLNSKVPNTRTVNGQPLSADVVIDTTNSFSDITGQPNDNENLATVLNTKQDTLISGTNIKTINNTSLLGSGNIEISASVPDATQSVKGIMKLYTSTGSNTDGTMTQNAINSSLNSKQATLVSGTNIKTINNTSILGSVNISISGGVTISEVMSAIYPVGSLYITTSTSSTCPIKSYISGSTWTLVSTDRVLQGASSASGAGGTKSAGLPNITGNTNSNIVAHQATSTVGALQYTKEGGAAASGSGSIGYGEIYLDASDSSSIYGNSTTVQPPAYLVNVWKRTA